jgi:cyclophilin family peptidyl-prolyl cis-trans isomerase
MNRTIPLALILVLLVLAGIWFSRQPGKVSVQAQANTEQTTSEESTDTPQGESPEESDEPSEPASTEDATTQGDSAAEETTEARTQPEIPEGFSLTPFRSETAEREFNEAEQVLDEAKDYQALIQTNKGTLRLELYEAQTPMTVNNFVFLALNHYYDGVVFHRVLEGFMAQTGDPTGTGAGGPGYQFANEIVDSLKHDKRGTLSMANAGPDTNGSQFFITFAETPWLDGQHTVFGELLEGDDVLENLVRIDPSNPGTPTVIAPLDMKLSELAAKGVALNNPYDVTLEDHLLATHDGTPAIGESFEVDGFQAISGRVGETPAIGFYLPPDKMEAVYIIERPRAE